MFFNFFFIQTKKNFLNAIKVRQDLILKIGNISRTQCSRKGTKKHLTMLYHQPIFYNDTKVILMPKVEKKLHHLV